MTKKQKAQIWNRYGVPIVETIAAGIVGGGGVWILCNLVHALKVFAASLVI